MNEALRWLVGLKTLQPGQEGVRFGFEHALPAWAWALVVLAAAALAYGCYRRLEGSRLARVGLGVARAALLIAIAVLLSGPRLIKPNETEEKDWVLVLVDRSASLTVPDGPGDGEGGKRTTREQQLRSALEKSKGVWKSLGVERVVVWLGFDAGAYELPVGKEGPGEGLPRLEEPGGRRTDLARAMDQALRRAAARPLSGVVVLSDGRSIEEPGRTIVRTLEAQRVPVFTVALGSAKGVADLAVKRADAPRSAFIRDTVPVQVEIERTGPGAIEPGERAVVELIDTATGATLDSRTIDWGEDDGTAGAAPEAGSGELVSRVKRMTMTTRPTLAGSNKWLVRVKPAGGGSGADAADMIESNNTQPVSVELVDRPLRIAYFDGYPRWEYRYLKNLLVREQSVSSVVMLLAPGKRYIQEGTTVLDALPRSPEEWSKFDVIVMGDVWPGVFTPDQLEQLKQRIAVGGAGLIWIGGEGATPSSWRSTPLGDLLPFALGEGGASVLPSFGGTGLLMAPTPAAERLGVLRLSETESNGSFWPPALSQASTGWSVLRWAQKIDPGILKPTAEVLATVRPEEEEGGRAESTPVVISMRFGAGRALYVATDEIWRWRYGQGERLPERFWVQLVRLLGRESLARSERSALLEVSPERAEVSQPVRVSVTVLDQSLVDAAPASIRVRIRRPVAGAGEEQTVAELSLAPEGSAGSGSGNAGARWGATRSYASTWIPAEPGRYRAEVNDPLIAARAAMDRAPGGLSLGVEVFQPDDEMRQPQADHALLARLSQSTGGRVLSTDQLAELPKLLPNRRLRLAGEPEVQTLWDSPLALIVVIGLLSLEWVGRRLLRLV